MRRDRSGPIAGVVLAAGESSRMGRNKLFFEILEGETLLRRAVATSAAAGLEPVISVLGHEAERARTELAGAPTQVVVNPNYARGLGSSVHVAIAAIPESAIAAVVLLADMPFITPEMLMTLIARYRSGAAPLVVSSYGEVQAPPILYDRSLFGELQGVAGESGGKQVIRRHQREAVVVTWPPHTGIDLDTPDDVTQLPPRKWGDR